jgi:sucrose-specific phosphotransferase system IIBC component
VETHEIAESLTEAVGGRENITSAAHCATRLRLVLADESKADKRAVEAIPDVKGSFSAGGQFQVILGPGLVDRVFRAMEDAGSVREASVEEVKAAAAATMNPAQRLVKLLSDIFVPLIPALVASGLLMGINNLLVAENLFGEQSLISRLPAIADIADVINMMANAAFVFLPILIAISSAKVFGANMYLGAVVGMIMVHPQLANAWTQGPDTEINTWSLFGLEFEQIGYQGTVLPVLGATWVLAKAELWLKDRMPGVANTLLTPLLAVLASGFVTLFLIGPILRTVGDLITTFFVNFYEVGGVLAGAIMGGTYSILVITGLHHSFHGVEAGLLADPEIQHNFLLPIWSMANFAQGGAALAAYLLLRNRQTKIKDIAPAAALSAFMGITEPAVFGVNLRLMTPFLGALIGGAAGGAWVAATNVTMQGIGATGIPGTALVTPDRIPAYVIGLAIAAGVAVAATFVLVRVRGFAKEAEEELEQEEVESVAIPAGR